MAIMRASCRTLFAISNAKPLALWRGGPTICRPARMPIQFFNTLTRQLEPFTPLDPAGRRVRMYTCGPTVYNFAHIGNFRAYIFEDLLERHLAAQGFVVERVMNLTDVDDKTI